jgi:CRP-like cAMP-binding protein
MMEQPSTLAALKASAFGMDLPPGVVQQLAAAARWKRCLRGDILFREGDVNRSFYIVQSGSIALDMCPPARGCQRLLTLGTGELVAWSALLDEGKMTATATALGDAELLEFSGADVQRLCDSDPVFGYHLMQRLSRALSKRLVATRLQLLDLFRQDVATLGATLP